MRPLKIVRTHEADGTLSPEMLTNIKVKDHAKRGSGMINVATVLLFLLAVVLFYVSLKAQFTYIMNVKHDSAVSWAEAGALDAGMVIFTLLALGLARAGQSARIERMMIIACAVGSALMNYAAVYGGGIRADLAYTLPSIFLAIVVDRTVSVIRRHYLGESDASAWSNFGKVSLYFLRFCFAAPSTISGLRRYILIKAPIPAAPVKFKPLPILTTDRPDAVIVAAAEAAAPKAVKAPKRPAAPKAVAAKVTPLKLAPASSGTRGFTPRPGSKTDQLVKLAISEHGSLSAIPLDRTSAIATVLAAKVGLDGGAARTALKKAVIAVHAAAETEEASA